LLGGSIGGSSENLFAFYPGNEVDQVGGGSSNALKITSGGH
jgi:hypothetical protein|tara:strand:+ start:3778 stop:3900 length:123 start_codon:yes stop_codon:yes gene_type:complete